jgi:predicted nuclease with TOPRIM domain
MIKTLFLFLTSLLFLVACNDNVKDLKIEVAALRLELANLKAEVAMLKNSTSSLEQTNSQARTQAEDQALLVASDIVYQAGLAIMKEDTSLGAIAVAQALQVACNREGDVPVVKVFGKAFNYGWTNLDTARSKCEVVAENDDVLQVVMVAASGRRSVNGQAVQ